MQNGFTRIIIVCPTTQRANLKCVLYSLLLASPVFSSHWKAGNIPYHSLISPYSTYHFLFSARLTNPQQTEAYLPHICIWIKAQQPQDSGWPACFQKPWARTGFSRYITAAHWPATLLAAGYPSENLLIHTASIRETKISQSKSFSLRSGISVRPTRQLFI